MEISLIQA